MPTRPRKRSGSGFYHVFHRGVNRFDIFEDDEDRGLFLARLQLYAANYGVELHAWCLMSNHFHLLVRAELGALSAMMRQLGSAYARRFNLRHGRSGPLFEGGFRSVCVEGDPQVMALVRYIHRNPVRHEEATLLGGYPWSSYGEYASGAPATCETAFVTSLFGGVPELVRFHEEERDWERVLDVDRMGPMGDEEARGRANDLLERSGVGVTVSGIGRLARRLRDEAIALVQGAVGCSMRQLQRLSGIPYSAIRAAVEMGPGDLCACT